MSTPRSLALPKGVEKVLLESERGSFAAHRAKPVETIRGRVLLIPGWTGSKEDFTPVLPLLADAGFEAVAYDQRGQFETVAADDSDYSLSGFAQDAIAVGKAAFDGAGFHVLGHSFGGLVAQTAALANSEDVRSLSLLCTGPGALVDSPDRPMGHMVEALRSPMDINDIFEAKEAGNTAPPDIMDFLRQRFVANSRASLLSMSERLLDAEDIVDEVAATSLPVWVARGVGDDAWPWEQQDKMAARLGTEVVLIEDAKHSPAVENPQGLAEAWLPFLRGLSSF